MQSKPSIILDTLLILSLVAGVGQAIGFVMNYSYKAIDSLGVLVLYEVLVLLVFVFIVRLLYYDFHAKKDRAHIMTRYLVALLIAAFGLEMLLGADTPLAVDFVFQFICVICYQMQTDPCLDRKASTAQFKGFIPLNFYNLFWIFIICSIVGLFGETVVSAIIDGKWESRAGFVWGPLSPIYGVGGVLITSALNRFYDKNPFLLFLFAGFVGMAFEGFAGWFWQSSFGIVAWDYSSMPGNINGYTCPEIAIVWGAAGIAWMKILLPLIMEVADAMPMKWRIPVTLVLSTFIFVDAILTVSAFNYWFERKSGIQDNSAVAQFFATYFDDAFMERRFETMSMFTSLARW